MQLILLHKSLFITALFSQQLHVGLNTRYPLLCEGLVPKLVNVLEMFFSYQCTFLAFWIFVMVETSFSVFFVFFSADFRA